MRLTISPGNSKLGKIPNLSLPPGASCRPGAPCLKEGCYAMKSYRMYPNVRKVWDGNLELWNTDPEQFEWELNKWFDNNPPKFFRWHVGGDIPDLAYFNMMLRMAGRYPKTKFLVFSKRYDFIPATPLSGNFSLIFSAWPGLERPPSGCSIAWLSKDSRKPQEYFKCRGNCSAGCHKCWDAGRLGLDIVFDKH